MDEWHDEFGADAAGGGASASPSVPAEDGIARETAWRCDLCKRTVPANVAHSCTGAPPMNDSERLGYDAVNLPTHYKAFKVEPIRFCQENGLSFLQSSIIKYVVRFPHKNGVEDLRKAARCLDMLLAFEEGDPDWWRLPGERESRRTYII